VVLLGDLVIRLDQYIAQAVFSNLYPIVVYATVAQQHDRQFLHKLSLRLKIDVKNRVF
jgi:hypothetical protein